MCCIIHTFVVSGTEMLTTYTEMNKPFISGSEMRTTYNES